MSDGRVEQHKSLEDYAFSLQRWVDENKGNCQVVCVDHETFLIATFVVCHGYDATSAWCGVFLISQLSNKELQGIKELFDRMS